MRNSTTVQDIRALAAKIQPKTAFAIRGPKTDDIVRWIKDFLDLFEHAFVRLVDLERKMEAARPKLDKLSELETQVSKLQRELDRAKVALENAIRHNGKH